MTGNAVTFEELGASIWNAVRRNDSVAMGVPRSKAVQALSELLCHHELERVTDRDSMEVRIVMGKEERP